MSVFVLSLATLRQGHGQLEVAGPPEDAGLVGDEWVAPIRGRLEVDRSGDRFSVRAMLETEVQVDCARCLTPIRRLLTGEMVLYSDRAGSSGRREQDELERGDYMLFHDGRQLDLREQVRESLLIELPMALLCREDCRGLCSVCGANLNEGPCGCAPESAPRAG